MQRWQHPVELHRSMSLEPKERAVGNGAGILLTAVTSTGCILGLLCRKRGAGIPKRLDSKRQRSCWKTCRQKHVWTAGKV